MRIIAKIQKKRKAEIFQEANMSFDLKIVNGELAINNTGDLASVENTEKLVQDVIKIISTEISSNPFFPWYGCPITQSLIGRAMESTFLSNVASVQLKTSLERLQTLQAEQLNNNQVVTPDEQIALIQNASVEQNTVDPRFYRIFVKVITKALNPVDVPLQIEVL